MNNFTSGPWTALPQGETGAESWYIINGEEWTSSVKWVASAQGTNVCSEDPIEIAANARLIARSPDMHGVLERMVSDDAFADLCAGIGEEPSWLKDARSILAAVKNGVFHE